MFTMKKPNVISYDNSINDYLINGKSLLKHLAKHENIDPEAYLPAVLCQPNSVDRLNMEADPDLNDCHIAPFNKVRHYHFEFEQYKDFIYNLREHEVTD